MMLSLRKSEKYWDTEECREQIMAAMQANDPLKAVDDVADDLYFKIYCPYIEAVLECGGQPIFEDLEKKDSSEKDSSKKYYGANDLAMMLGVEVVSADQKFAKIPRYLNDVLRSWILTYIEKQKHKEFNDKFIAGHINQKRINQAQSKEERERIQIIEHLNAQDQLAAHYITKQKYQASIADTTETTRQYSEEQQALLDEYLEQHHQFNEKGEKGIAFYCLKHDEFEQHFVSYYDNLAHENVNRILNPTLYKPGTQIIKQNELSEEDENGRKKYTSYYLRHKDLKKDLNRNKKLSDTDENWFWALTMFNHDEEIKSLIDEYRTSEPARQKTLWYRVLVELSQAREAWSPFGWPTWNKSNEIDEFLRIVYGK
ncbi:hypothetical protein ACLHIM_00030 [Ligilactobacillus sp. LYQ112]|uniref:hypothetical protein n=1 Tax=Ligilactobacillus sp. LYQ112 TaxID=3391060 RepID=UPI003983261B